MFHRGVGVLRMKELFIVQKVDLLVSYLVAWPAKQVRVHAWVAPPQPWWAAAAHLCARRPLCKQAQTNESHNHRQACRP